MDNDDIRNKALEAMEDADLVIGRIGDISFHEGRSCTDIGDDLDEVLFRTRQAAMKLALARDLAYSKQLVA